jgi:hypothetical protein
MPVPAGVRSYKIQTDRLHTHLLERGPAGNTAVVLVHGNVSSCRFFDELLAAMPGQMRTLAPAAAYAIGVMTCTASLKSWASNSFICLAGRWAAGW